MLNDGGLWCFCAGRFIFTSPWRWDTTLFLWLKALQCTHTNSFVSHSSSFMCSMCSFACSWQPNTYSVLRFPCSDCICHNMPNKQCTVGPEPRSKSVCSNFSKRTFHTLTSNSGDIWVCFHAHAALFLMKTQNSGFRGLNGRIKTQTYRCGLLIAQPSLCFKIYLFIPRYYQKWFWGRFGLEFFKFFTLYTLTECFWGFQH